MYKSLKKYILSRQFYFWIGSYAIILILAILINLIGYFAAVRVIETEIRKSNMSILEEITSICDNSFAEASRVIYGLLLSDSAQELNANIPNRYLYNTYTKRVLEDIEYNITGNSYIEDCAIVYRNNNLAIHSKYGATTVDILYSNYFNEWNPSQEKWLEEVFSISGVSFDLLESDDGQSDIFVTCRVPNHNRNVAVIAKFDTNKLVGILQGEVSENERGILFDDNGILYSDNTYNTDEELNELKNLFIGNDSSDAKKEGWLIEYKESDSTPFKYAYMISDDIYFKNINNVKLAFIIGYLLIVFAGGAIAFCFSCFNERERCNLDAEIEKHRNYIRENSLRNALERKNVDIAYLLQEYPFLKYKPFVVLAFDAIASGNNASDKKNYERVTKYIIGEIKSKYEQEEICCTSIGNILLVIVCTKNKTDLLTLKKLAEEICIFLNREARLDVRCAISQMLEKVENLHNCYEQVIETMNQRYLSDSELVYLYDDIIVEFPSYMYTDDDKDCVKRLLNDGKGEELEGFINDMFTQKDNHITLAIYRLIITELITTIMMENMKFGIENSALQEAYMKAIQIKNFYQFQEVKGILIENVKKLCESKSMIAVSDKNSKYKKIAAYVEEHCADPELNVNILADRFKINRSWLSHNFKLEIGVSLSEYIVRCRISKAKELLKTDKAIKQIATEVGFLNETVYYRAFKKYEGMTSIQYRKLLETQSEDNKMKGEGI